MESSSSSKKEWRTKYSLKDQDSEFQTAMSPKSLLSLTAFFLTRRNKRLERKRKQHNSKKKAE
jgi:hypothetical protein